jgi:hypothetical protein
MRGRDDIISRVFLFAHADCFCTIPSAHMFCLTSASTYVKQLVKIHRMRISYATFLLAFICSLVSHAQTPKVQHQIDSLLALTQHEKDTDKLSYHLYLISKHYKSFNKIKSLKYAKDAYNQVNASQKDTLKRLVYKTLAIAYFETDDLANAFQFYKKELALEKELNDVKEEAKTIYNIGLLYNSCDDPVNSQKYLKKASQLINENNILDKDLIMGINEAMATNWYKLNKLDSAGKYQKKSLGNILKYKLTHRLIGHYYNTAVFAFKKRDYKNCAEQLALMHKAEVEQNDYLMEAFHLYLNSELAFASSNFKLAEKNALVAMKLAKQNGYKEAAELASSVIARIKEKSNQFDSALYYSKLSRLYRDSLKGSTIKNLLQFADTDMEEYESALLDLELQSQRKTMILLVGGIVLFTLLVVLTYKFLRREKKLKDKVELKNKDISEQNLKLVIQTTELESVMHTMEEVVKEKSLQINTYAFYNSHRLRAPIARILGLGKLKQISPSPEEKTYISTKICELTEELEAMRKEGQQLVDNK